jgi:hypothetical protein
VTSLDHVHKDDFYDALVLLGAAPSRDEFEEIWADLVKWREQERRRRRCN